ncbi:DUF1232 domain-containing protein [Halobacillus shinanisalinarum]|uniref:DUF1232 domain-containing protein n=1 Tax=Halobacillus shinanisalinarum TaxID=2932258 RepID=A0ABY4GUT9_9BACI|nr:DUF1232 domain-containing protein [Halobacillus shinanisalinarum]UOQ91754.1 DUF1232 domain-containing protein [Halobacillus shinanisalinarum]
MRRIWRRIKFLFNIRKSVPFLLSFFRSHEVARSSKVTAVLLMIGYLLFPWDVIPDFLVIFGLVDDVAVLTFILQQIVKMAPSSLKKEYDMEE